MKCKRHPDIKWCKFTCQKVSSLFGFSDLIVDRNGQLRSTGNDVIAWRRRWRHRDFRAQPQPEVVLWPQQRKQLQRHHDQRRFRTRRAFPLHPTDLRDAAIPKLSTSDAEVWEELLPSSPWTLQKFLKWFRVEKEKIQTRFWPGSTFLRIALNKTLLIEANGPCCTGLSLDSTTL